MKVENKTKSKVRYEFWVTHNNLPSIEYTCHTAEKFHIHKRALNKKRIQFEVFEIDLIAEELAIAKAKQLLYKHVNYQDAALYLKGSKIVEDMVVNAIREASSSIVVHRQRDLLIDFYTKTCNKTITQSYAEDVVDEYLLFND